jgi:hypothetical protein
MAIASLVLSALWILGLGSLLGIIFGHVSRGQLRTRPQRGGGIALAGLIVGYVGLIGAVVFWALLPKIIHSGPVQDIIVQQDIRDAATAEDAYQSDNGTYTASGNALRDEGFTPLGRNTIAVAFDSNAGYCIVGAADGSSTWYVYDSDSSGLSDATYSSETVAESACTVSGVAAFTSIN